MGVKDRCPNTSGHIVYNITQTCAYTYSKRSFFWRETSVVGFYREPLRVSLHKPIRMMNKNSLVWKCKNNNTKNKDCQRQTYCQCLHPAHLRSSSLGQKARRRRGKRQVNHQSLNRTPTTINNPFIVPADCSMEYCISLYGLDCRYIGKCGLCSNSAKT